MKSDKAILASIRKVIARGSARILEEDRNGIFLCDTVSNIYMIASEDTGTGYGWLKAHESETYGILMICADRKLAVHAADRYGLKSGMDCYQAVYRGRNEPPLAGSLTFRPAADGDLAVVMKHYDKLTKEELLAVISRKNLLIGEKDGRMVGFVGEHLEGSMGMLFVLPEFRGRGYGAELERAVICRTIRQGYEPFCQVETENRASLHLQKKLGLEISDEHLYLIF